MSSILSAFRDEEGDIGNHPVRWVNCGAGIWISAAKHRWEKQQSLSWQIASYFPLVLLASLWILFVSFLNPFPLKVFKHSWNSGLCLLLYQVSLKYDHLSLLPSLYMLTLPCWYPQPRPFPNYRATHMLGTPVWMIHKSSTQHFGNSWLMKSLS